MRKNRQRQDRTVRVLRTGREGNFKERRTFSEPLDSESGGAVLLILPGPQLYVKTILDGLGERQVNGRVPSVGCVLLFQEVP